MNTQSQLFHGGTFQLRADAVPLGRLGGDLTVVDGRVWLTRSGALDDVFVEPGERIRLGVGEHTVIEAAHAGEAATVRWSPRRQSFFGALVAEPLRGIAFAAGLAARGLGALARSAAASASRAQGCISGGDSMASSGALK
jgi:Protein of unknown function (DUF2917)